MGYFWLNLVGEVIGEWRDSTGEKMGSELLFYMAEKSYSSI